MKRPATKKGEEQEEPLAKKQLQLKANSLLNAQVVDTKALKTFVQLLVSH